MILPNKLISFQDCILAKTVYILEKISDSDFFSNWVIRTSGNSF